MTRTGKISCIGLYVLLTAVGAFAQVTGSGTPGTVPVFTGSSSIGNSSAPIVVGSNGNVGIGTAYPNARLHLVGNSPIVVIQDASSGYPGVQLQNSAGYYSSQLDGGNGSLYWYNGTIRTLTLKQNGYLGIGTPEPNSPLNIATGAISANYQINNAINVQPTGGEASAGNGASVYFSSVTNSGVTTIGGVWSALEDGGSGGTTYDGSLVFGSVRKGSSSPVEGMRLNAEGNIGIGTTTPGATLEVNGNVKLTANSGSSIIFPDSTSQTTAWTGVLCGVDYAEAVDISDDRTQYEPGDVLVIDPNVSGRFLKSAEPYSTAVAGIYSTKPGAIGRRQSVPKDPDEIPMAMIGIVPAKASAENGAIHRGDLLVTSSTPGYAMKGTDRTRLTGAVLGKALDNLENGTGVIEVAVTLQ